MLNLGIVGLGSIAQKAYLPAMRQMAGIHWHLYTRRQEVAQELAGLFGQASLYQSLEELAQARLDGVFIHMATALHFETASFFLKRAIPVYMDKPLTEDYNQTAQLYDLADRHGTFLMAGFNRRFAPRVQELKALEGKSKLYLAKDAENSQNDFQFELFDMFIHPLDTALFLMDGKPTYGSFMRQKQSGKFEQCQVLLANEHEQTVVSMNARSGARREVMEVQTSSGTYHLKDLTDLTIFRGNKTLQQAFSSWNSTLYQRGFESIILAFIEGIKTGHNPVSAQSSLLSHYICQQINDAATNQGELSFDLPVKGEA